MAAKVASLSSVALAALSTCVAAAVSCGRMVTVFVAPDAEAATRRPVSARPPASRKTRRECRMAAPRSEAARQDTPAHVLHVGRVGRIAGERALLIDCAHEQCRVARDEERGIPERGMRDEKRRMRDEIAGVDGM